MLGWCTSGHAIDRSSWSWRRWPSHFWACTCSDTWHSTWAPDCTILLYYRTVTLQFDWNPLSIHHYRRRLHSIRWRRYCDDFVMMVWWCVHVCTRRAKKYPQRIWLNFNYFREIRHKNFTCWLPTQLYVNVESFITLSTELTKLRRF